MVYRLTKAAERDLAEIYEYGLTQFGQNVADDYLAELISTFELIEHSPKIGTAYQGFRRFSKGRHIVFYQITTDTLIVVRIMHERMQYRISYLLVD